MEAIATIRVSAVFLRWGECVDPFVVLSEERIGHIKQRHPGAYEQYGNYTSSTIEDPDYILEDAKNSNTAIFIRHVESLNLNVVVKLSVKDGQDKMNSSVITLYPMSEKRLRRLLRKTLPVYKNEKT